MNEKKDWSDEVAEEVRGTSDWTDDDGEVRELTALDIARMKPFSSMPPELQAMLLSIKTATFVPDEEKVPVPVEVSAGGLSRSGR